jgi:hypothetical protein
MAITAQLCHIKIAFDLLLRLTRWHCQTLRTRYERLRHSAVVDRQQTAVLM